MVERELAALQILPNANKVESAETFRSELFLYFFFSSSFSHHLSDLGPSSDSFARGDLGLETGVHLSERLTVCQVGQLDMLFLVTLPSPPPLTGGIPGEPRSFGTFNGLEWSIGSQTQLMRLCHWLGLR